MSHCRSIIRMRGLHPTCPHKNLTRVQTEPCNDTERKPKDFRKIVLQLVTHFSSTECILQSHLFAHLCCILYQSDHEVTMSWWLPIDCVTVQGGGPIFPLRPGLAYSLHRASSNLVGIKGEHEGLWVLFFNWVTFLSFPHSRDCQGNHVEVLQPLVAGPSSVTKMYFSVNVN